MLSVLSWRCPKLVEKQSWCCLLLGCTFDRKDEAVAKTLYFYHSNLYTARGEGFIIIIYNYKCKFYSKAVFHKVTPHLGQRNTFDYFQLTIFNTTPFMQNCIFVCKQSLSRLHGNPKKFKSSPIFSKKRWCKKCSLVLHSKTEIQPQFSLPNGLFKIKRPHPFHKSNSF